MNFGKNCEYCKKYDLYEKVWILWKISFWNVNFHKFHINSHWGKIGKIIIFVRKIDLNLTFEKLWILWKSVIFLNKCDVCEKMWFLWKSINCVKNWILWKSVIFVKKSECCEKCDSCEKGNFVKKCEFSEKGNLWKVWIFR